jgi:hypothetical protein
MTARPGIARLVTGHPHGAPAVLFANLYFARLSAAASNVL